MNIGFKTDTQANDLSEDLNNIIFEKLWVSSELYTFCNLFTILSLSLLFLLWLYSPLDLDRFLSFLIYTQSAGRLWGGSARCKVATTHRTIQTQISMRRMGFEPRIPVFQQAKTVHALDRAATVTGFTTYSLPTHLLFIRESDQLASLGSSALCKSLWNSSLIWSRVSCNINRSHCSWCVSFCAENSRHTKLLH
jgi:hypothetical protein